MRKLVGIITALLVMALTVVPLHRAVAVGPNLIANPSAETAVVANQPDNWVKGGWGTNTATHTYVTNDGHTGTCSLRVDLTAHTSGDAKWFANPVAVTAGQSYTYADWYKSSVASDIVAEYQDASGKYSYAWLTSPELSASWKQASANFTVPAGAIKVSIFHLINKKGWLQIDDASINAQTEPAPIPTPNPIPASGNTIPNPSFETANGNAPAGWTANAWGNNSATFSYLNSGQHGNRSAKVEMTARTDGDAKWTYAPQAVTTGKTYQFTNYYQSNTITDINVAVTMNDGTTKYYWLGSAQPSSTWQQFKAQFTMPEGAKSASVMHILYNIGWLTTDNYSFAPYTPTGFNRGLVSLTFDDSWRSIYTNGLPILKKYNLLSTQYLLSGVSQQAEYMTPAMMKAFKNAGHEIASHTVSHEHLTQLSPAELDTQLRQSKQDLTKLTGVTPTNFATPYGEYNQEVLTAIKKYYSSHRGVEAGFNSKDNFDIYNIKVQNIFEDTSAAQVAAWVAQAKQTKTWLVLVYHEIGSRIGGDIYWVPTMTFDAHMKAVKNSNVRVVTVQQALNEIKPQVAK